MYRNIFAWQEGRTIEGLCNKGPAIACNTILHKEKVVMLKRDAKIESLTTLYICLLSWSSVQY
jgi:hypothetical protein